MKRCCVCNTDLEHLRRQVYSFGFFHDYPQLVKINISYYDDYVCNICADVAHCISKKTKVKGIAKVIK